MAHAQFGERIDDGTDNRQCLRRARVLAKVKAPLKTSIVDDEGDLDVLAPLLSEAEIVVGHI